MKDILKGSALIFAFKVIGAASLFGVHLLIARHYGASELGIFNLMIALLMFGGIFSKLGLDMYVVRILPEIEDDRTQVAGFLQRVFKLLLIGSLFSAFLFFLASPLINEYIFKSFDALSYLYCLALVMIPATFFNVVPEIFRGLGDIKIYSFFRNVAQNIFTLLLLVLALFVFQKDIDPIYLFYVVLIILTIVMGVIGHKFLLQKKINIFSNAYYDQKIIKYSYPMLLTVSMMFMMGNVDSLMISYYLDEKHVGVYAACLKISMMTPFVLAAINGFIAPNIAKSYAQNDFIGVKKTYYNAIKLILPVSIPVFFGVVFFSDSLLGLFGEGFRSAFWVLWIISFSGLVTSAFGPIGYLLCLTDAQNIVARVVFVAMISNLGLNFVMIPNFGLLGAALATLLSTIVWNVMLFFYARRHGVLQ